MGFEPLSLWDDTGQVRRTDPPTAHTAASRVRPRTARWALMIAHAANPGGLTDEEAADLAGLSLRSEYATRCSELARAGYLEDTDRSRAGDAGLPRMVRRITTDGRRAMVDELEAMVR